MCMCLCPSIVLSKLSTKHLTAADISKALYAENDQILSNLNKVPLLCPAPLMSCNDGGFLPYQMSDILQISGCLKTSGIGRPS